jgi:hypothetical protein
MSFARRTSASKPESTVTDRAMPDIAIDTRLPDPQAVVAPRLLTVLGGYSSRDDVVLALDVGIAGAAMSVPVTVELRDSPTRTPNAIPIALRATHHSGLFPAFHGAVRSEGVGNLESVLRLDGTYETPLGMFGSIADRTVLGHAAERSLRSFLERLRADVIAEIQRAELSIRRSEGRHT